MHIRRRMAVATSRRRRSPALLGVYIACLVAIAAVAVTQAAAAASLPPRTDSLAAVEGVAVGESQPLLAALDIARRDVVLATIVTGIAAVALVYVVFRVARSRLDQQERRLADVWDRDGLTKLPSHGALVAELGEAVESARRNGGTIAVALIDIDSFRLLNDTHGHWAGDEALLRVSHVLARELPKGMRVGRYGPDEFLIISPEYAMSQLEASLRCFRSSLAEIDLRVGVGEPFPVTVSAGLAAYPQHATSVTGLLSVAAMTVAESKVSGGDTIRVAGVVVHDPVATRSFDVLKGLVQAVDTKDHYTKRHSEDVARYAVFLAGQMGMTDHFARAVDIASHLHDIGKIGVPDAILRKPGRLTADELRVMEQHSALGDMIVRDLPDIDLVRQAIRHHHERWDGRGYPDRIVGESIPLIARILAVCDSFSAMTTTRPYRKAYSMRQAMQRIEAAAGTQLDPELARTFVRALRTVPEAPVPQRVVRGEPVRWFPGREIA